MGRLRHSLAAAGLLLAVASPAAAGTPPGAAPAVVVALGGIGVEPGEDAAGALELQYRFAPAYEGVQPEVGAFVASDESAYGWLGFGRDFPFARRWVAHISFGAGAYERGDGKELGQTLEFRSAIDVAWRASERLRIGLMLAHLSNAGLSEINPGTETLTVSFAWRPRR